MDKIKQRVPSPELQETKSQQFANRVKPEQFLNRELAGLNFQRRVLHEAEDARNPLLERVRFLSIVSNNLDEFYMVRVGGLMMQIAGGVMQRSPDGRTSAEQLADIRKEAKNLMAAVSTCWQDVLMPELEISGIHILNYEQLETKQRESIDQYFREVIFPVLTPLAFDIGHPFPHISNLSLNLAIALEGPTPQEPRFARLKVPTSIPRLLPVKRSSGGTRKDGTVPHHHYFVWIEQVIAANLSDLFPGIGIREVHPFRVVRNADMVIQELEAGDLLETMEESVRKRRFGAVVQLAINSSMPTQLREILETNLQVDSRDVYEFSGPLGLEQLVELAKVDRFDIKYARFVPATPRAFQSETGDVDYFETLRRTDVLIRHPYDSFSPVEKFLRQAARDPDVLAIKQTLYRVGKDSHVVDCLLEARRDFGKQVAVLVELKARFDEESNISWARILEEEGVHVTYGLLGLKTHSKIAMVVRREGEGIRRYMHIGTGNYNDATAGMYEDIGLFTADPEIGADATDLFNFLTGYSARDQYRKLLVAPVNLRPRLEELIKQEISAAEAGRGGRLIFKMNSLVDQEMIQLLYRASLAGVQVDLLIRGICCLRPGVKGLSENIRVRSVVGRFLEHSRVYYFANSGSPIVYIGSADLMPRNLNSRVEILTPVEDATLIQHLYTSVLEPYCAQDIRVWEMQADGSYTYNGGAYDVQERSLSPDS